MRLLECASDEKRREQKSPFKVRFYTHHDEAGDLTLLLLVLKYKPLRC